MTPGERAKWCIAQAEETERTLPAHIDDDSPKPISYYTAKRFRQMAFDLLEGMEGRA